MKSSITSLLLLTLAWMSGLTSMAAGRRPPIVAVAGIGVKVSDLEEARKFYTGVVGLEEAFTIKNPAGGSDLHAFKINDRQYVNIAPDLKSPNESRLIYISLETTNAKALRSYLASKNVAVPNKIQRDAEGNFSFSVKDPDGNLVQFIQFEPKGLHLKNTGRFVSDKRLSNHALHAGMHIKDEAKANAFYRDILGFRLQWKGGPTDDRFEWVSMLVPDGNTWLEYMVKPGNPSIGQLGSMNHICLGTTEIQKLHETVVSRGYKVGAPTVARDGRYLLHLFDKDRSRTEIMVRKPVEKPCCAPMNDVTQ